MNINVSLALPDGFKQVTISSTAVGLVNLPSTPFTQAQIDEMARIVISVNSGAIRIRYDGTNPTTTIGHLFRSGNVFQIVGNANLENFRIIRDGTTDAEIALTAEG